MNGASPMKASESYKFICKKDGHQYQWADEGGYPYGSIGGSQNAPTSLRDIYGGRFVKHLFCPRCGEYRNAELKSAADLKAYLNLNKIKE